MKGVGVSVYATKLRETGNTGAERWVVAATKTKIVVEGPVALMI